MRSGLAEVLYAQGGPADSEKRLARALLLLVRYGKAMEYNGDLKSNSALLTVVLHD